MDVAHTLLAQRGIIETKKCFLLNIIPLGKDSLV